MNQLFINAYEDFNSRLFVNIETFIILHIYKLADSDNVQVLKRTATENSSKSLIEIDFTDINFTDVINPPDVTLNCVWPIIVFNKNIISGLSSVARHLLKNSKNKEVRSLLGFREACLVACSESSIWTRFCEVDIINTTKKLMNDHYFEEDKIYLPEDIARFEFHMSKPVRMHNIYKLAREQNNDKSIKSDIPIAELNLEHAYGEGTCMTLSDVVLYPCFKIFFSKCPFNLVEDRIPLTVEWFKKMSETFLETFNFTLPQFQLSINKIIEPEFEKHSLYASDPSRYRPEKRIYTKQNDIESALEAINSLESEIINNYIPFGHEISFNWSNIPLEANPNGGALPEKRANRKCEQLENMAKAVVKLAGDKQYKIVDFCSGSGHLGILLAVLLPQCTIVLVENKEHSLTRARQRIEKLKLTNILIIQSNLDYFTGTFDIGVSLHACGVATDLVIQKCIENRAHFVTCPCCYGGVKDCHHLKYPRSQQFQRLNLEYKKYLSIAHAADQTHDAGNAKTKQGYKCMDIIDSDRKFYAESCGYEAHLGKLQPTSCTNKNNLLVCVLKPKQ